MEGRSASWSDSNCSVGTHDLVSVIIPTYNRAYYLRRALDSALRQSHLNVEIILVDDFSTDGTRAILVDEMEKVPNIKVVYHEKNQGKGAGLRTGFQHVTGDVER